MSDPEILNASQAAAMLQVKLKTLYALCNKKVTANPIPHSRSGKTNRLLWFRRSKILAWLDKNEVNSTPPTTHESSDDPLPFFAAKPPSRRRGVEKGSDGRSARPVA